MMTGPNRLRSSWSCHPSSPLTSSSCLAPYDRSCEMCQSGCKLRPTSWQQPLLWDSRPRSEGEPSCSPKRWILPGRETEEGSGAEHRRDALWQVARAGRPVGPLLDEAPEVGAESPPGGLTKPMWDTLRDRFVDEMKSAGRKAIARAIVAYCDGKQVKTFVGERAGTIADRPRGSREFYWDTVFVPEDSSGHSRGLTYAEIVESADLGLAYKIRELSQSSAAMKSFLEYRLRAGDPELWR